MMMSSMLVFWLAAIVLCIAVMRYFFDQSYSQVEPREKQKRSPHESLQERYERGEVSRDEYHNIMNASYNQQEDNYV